jgi:hypothetical protein
MKNVEIDQCWKSVNKTRLGIRNLLFLENG